MCNTEMGLGSTPQEAYQDWRQENVGRRIDLGRYAGAYGGAHPDQEAAKRPVVRTGHFITGVMAVAMILVGIISVVMLWDAE